MKIILGYQKGQILEYGLWESVFSMFSTKKKWKKIWGGNLGKNMKKWFFTFFSRRPTFGWLPRGLPTVFEEKKIWMKKSFFSIFFSKPKTFGPARAGLSSSKSRLTENPSLGILWNVAWRGFWSCTARRGVYANTRNARSGRKEETSRTQWWCVSFPTSQLGNLGGVCDMGKIRSGGLSDWMQKFVDSDCARVWRKEKQKNRKQKNRKKETRTDTSFKKHPYAKIENSLWSSRFALTLQVSDETKLTGICQN